MAGRASGLLVLALALLALWAATTATTAVVAFTTGLRLDAPQHGGRVIMRGQGANPFKYNRRAGTSGGQTKQDYTVFKEAAAKKTKEEKKGPEAPKVYDNVKVIYNGKEVAQLNGTLPQYKVDIWSGAHPVWQGKKNRVMLDGGALTRFQEKFGKYADKFGDAGMDILERNRQVKKELEERRKQGLAVY